MRSKRRRVGVAGSAPEAGRSWGGCGTGEAGLERRQRARLESGRQRCRQRCRSGARRGWAAARRSHLVQVTEGLGARRSKRGDYRNNPFRGHAGKRPMRGSGTRPRPRPRPRQLTREFSLVALFVEDVRVSMLRPVEEPTQHVQLLSVIHFNICFGVVRLVRLVVCSSLRPAIIGIDA